MNIIRNHKKGIVVGTATGLVLTAGVAFAVYLLSLGITGSVSTGAAGWTYATTSGNLVTSCTGGSAAANTNASNDSLAVTATGLYPNDSCTFTPKVQTLRSTSNKEDLKVTKVKMTLPTGWTLEQVTPCGTTIPKSESTLSSGTPIEVAFKLIAGPTALGGQLSTASVDAVPASQFTAAMCN